MQLNHLTLQSKLFCLIVCSLLTFALSLFILHLRSALWRASALQTARPFVPTLQCSFTIISVLSHPRLFSLYILIIVYHLIYCTAFVPFLIMNPCFSLAQLACQLAQLPSWKALLIHRIKPSTLLSDLWFKPLIRQWGRSSLVRFIKMLYISHFHFLASLPSIERKNQPFQCIVSLWRTNVANGYLSI